MTPMGHGWITPNPDGSRARCGGPGICKVCQAELKAKSGGRMPGPDPGPIEPKFSLDMNELAHQLDRSFNGVVTGKDRKIGFFMAVFPFDEHGRFNYISNADKLDVSVMLRDILARLDKRLADEEPE